MDDSKPAGILHTQALNSAPQGPRFIVLDAVRGIGALLVIFGHYHFELWPEVNSFIISSSGHLVVDVFFLLSGFVLAHAFYDKPSFNFWEYAKKRVFRLWPLHVVTFIACAVIMFWAGDPISEKGLLLNFVLLHNIGIGDWSTNSFNYPSWSLSVELVANMVVGLIILAIPNRRWNSAILAGLILLSATILFFTVENLDQHARNVLGVVNTGLLRGFISFPLGILAYRFFTTHRAWFDRTSVLRSIWIGFLAVVLLATFCLPVANRVDFLYLPFYAFMIMVLASPGAFWEGVLSRFRILGTLSFAMYVVHMIVLKIMEQIPFWPQEYVAGLFVAWALSIALAAFAHYKIERPSYAWLTRHMSNPPAGNSLPEILQRKLARPTPSSAE
ncbi:acyltransferase family protein [Hyphomonas neptunium ATCC 15444]|uniref:Acyltransferase family protein n=2 Tax=Hyphomonas TaxID=85 RepID=Q0BYS8_HYPNA|nr:MULTISPECIES: acyltransferase [Hyphomonas]ABI76943.1 acyltransferase family protein [Hyphomonas neptunium ATCC 15444]KCZ91492.1 acyltransferase family protein [Hyphomonas hirschiana VP5]